MTVFPGGVKGGRIGDHRMAHHKRKGPKSTRRGCLFCKSWKHQGEAKIDRFKPSERRKLQDD